MQIQLLTHGDGVVKIVIYGMMVAAMYIPNRGGRCLPAVSS